MQKTAILTFDDGLANQHTVALPILERYGFTATFYVGQWIGGIYPDAPDHCITKEQLQDLHRRGHEIGNHTMRHPSMSSCDTARLHDEFAGVEELLISIGLPKPETAAYPGGPSTPDAIAVLRERGYRAARTCYPKPLTGAEEPLALPAFSVCVTTPEKFEEALSALTEETPVILVYHGVPSIHHPPCGIEPEVFEAQMAQLHEMGIRCISLKQYLDGE